MKTKSILVFFLIFSLILPVPARAGEEVKFGQGANGYLVMPQGGGKVPAVILVPEWWGLNDQMRGEAQKFADNGYAALVVDLYRGKATTDAAEAHELMRGLPDDQAVTDLKEAVTHLSGQPDIDHENIGVIGFCMGGGYALKLAIADPRIAALAIYYGKLVTDETELSKIKAPVLGIFGAEDRGISKESVLEFKQKLEKLGKRAEILLYIDAGHAFANPENPAYNETAAKAAWEKTLTFFKGNLA